MSSLGDKRIASLEKKKKPLVKEWQVCLKKSKCQRLQEEKEIESKIYDKRWNKECGKKKGAAYDKCDHKFFQSSKLKQLYDQIDECRNSVCIKERARIDKIVHDITILIATNPEIQQKLNAEFNKVMKKLDGNKKR